MQNSPLVQRGMLNTYAVNNGGTEHIMPENYYRFDLVPLPYDVDALEPYINTETMRVHHNRLLRAYVDKLNAVLDDCVQLQQYSLEQMLQNSFVLPPNLRTSIINFGGGVYNHNFFFETMRPNTDDNAPEGSLAKAIDHRFGSFREFKKQFKEKAMGVFGSGWAWLTVGPRKELEIVQTANQNTPITWGFRPIIVIDVWEHAYFLQYLNLRGDYIDNWWNVVDWKKAEAHYCASSMPMR